MIPAEKFSTHIQPWNTQILQEKNIGQKDFHKDIQLFVKMPDFMKNIGQMEKLIKQWKLFIIMKFVLTTTMKNTNMMKKTKMIMKHKIT